MSRVTRKELERRCAALDRALCRANEREQAERERAERAEAVVDHRTPRVCTVQAKVNGNTFSAMLPGDVDAWAWWLTTMVLPHMTGSPADRLELSITGVVR